ncbi:hypothetical protein IWW50_003928 [Coemansia erecta]|nr:hypothetical protein IWW50_003928 [Coemansia erecta]
MDAADADRVFLIDVEIAGHPCIALFDSGCTSMVASPQLVKLAKLTTTRPKKPMNMTLADKSKVTITRVLNNTEVKVGTTSGDYNMVVAPIKYDMIIGLPWITTNNTNVDWDKRFLSY